MSSCLRYLNQSTWTLAQLVARKYFCVTVVTKIIVSKIFLSSQHSSWHVTRVTRNYSTSGVRKEARCKIMRRSEEWVEMSSQHHHNTVSSSDAPASFVSWCQYCAGWKFMLIAQKLLTSDIQLIFLPSDAANEAVSCHNSLDASAAVSQSYSLSASDLSGEFSGSLRQ